MSNAIEATSADSGRPAGFRGLRVLVADPSEVVRKIVIGLLDARGHRVTAAGTPREFEQLSSEPQLDVVLVDPSVTDFESGRPTADGKECARRGARFIWLMMGGQAPPKKLRCELDIVLLKPFQPQELVAAVEYEPSELDGHEPIPEEVLDWEAAVRELQGRDDVLRELAMTFFPECDSLMKQIQEAMGTRDAPRLRRAAHTLKGAATMFCARATATAARNLEHLARDSRLDEAVDAFEALRREVDRLIPTLTARSRT